MRALRDRPVAGVIVGTGDGIPRLQQRAREYGIADRMVFAAGSATISAMREPDRRVSVDPVERSDRRRPDAAECRVLWPAGGIVASDVAEPRSSSTAAIWCRSVPSSTRTMCAGWPHVEDSSRATTTRGGRGRGHCEGPLRLRRDQAFERLIAETAAASSDTRVTLCT
jgi:hypothetical protein